MNAPTKGKSASFLLGGTLLFVGIVFAGEALGLYDFKLTSDLFRLWPVMIIVVGLALLSGHRRSMRVVSLIVLAGVLIVLGAFLYGGIELPSADEGTALLNAALLNRASLIFFTR